MNRKSFIFALVALILPTIAILAQDDDDEMYFGRKSKNDKTVRNDSKQQPRRIVVEYDDDVATTSSGGEADYHTGTLRDVDEYNRRGRRTSVADTAATVADSVVVARKGKKQASLYDLGYDDGYTRGYRDAEEDEFYYSTRLARFRGSRYYDPWYWDRIAYIYNPWYYDPWFWDPWYRPVYVGGWCSVGWGCTWGFSWGFGWSYSWHPGIHPHHPHHYGTGYRSMSVRNANAIHNNRYGGGRTMGMRSATTGTPRSYGDNYRNRGGENSRTFGRGNTYSGRPSRSTDSNNRTWGGSRGSSDSSSHSYSSPSRSSSSSSSSGSGGGFRSSGSGGGFRSSGGSFGGGGGFRGGRGR